jgi:NTP pyrophosphatase (non-canonical NTP hydrolase)
MNLEEYEEKIVGAKEMKLSPRELMLKNSLGLAGEAGEVIEHVKKWAWHGRALDVAKVKKELGDVVWYATAIARLLGIPMAEVLRENAEKLEARFPAGYTQEAYAARADERGSPDLDDGLEWAHGKPKRGL